MWCSGVGMHIDVNTPKPAAAKESPSTGSPSLSTQTVQVFGRDGVVDQAEAPAVGKAVLMGSRPADQPADASSDSLVGKVLPRSRWSVCDERQKRSGSKMRTSTAARGSFARVLAASHSAEEEVRCQ